MSDLILYSTSACHLCDQAKVLIAEVLAPDDRLREVDISDSEVLVERYGIRIPVLQREDSGEELGWPFDEQRLLHFLRS